MLSLSTSGSSARLWWLRLFMAATALALVLCADADPPQTTGSTKRRAMSVRSVRNGRSYKRDRDLLVGGRPTGGGKYPFLVIVAWDDYGEPVDPRFISYDIWCHGVMIAYDVVLTWNDCRPVKGYVLVGDSPNDSSYQYRRVISGHDIRATHLAPYVYMFKIEPVTFQGFYPASFAKDPATPFVGQNVTMAGYGGFTDMESGAYELYYPTQVKSVSPGFYFTAGGDEVGPCIGDYGIPVLDMSKSLLGIAFEAVVTLTDSCSVDPASFYQVSHVSDWMERTACAFSDLPEALPYCGPLVCPVDETVLGYPWALLPNRTESVVGIRGFAPMAVAQWPPPGTPLWRNTTTNITMTAFDASGRKFECRWKVFVPPLVWLGEATVYIRNGTYNETRQFVGYQLISGQVYKMRAKAGDKLRGDGSSVRAVIRDPSNKQTGRALKLLESADKATVSFPKVKVQFSDSMSDIKLDVQVSKNEQPNVLIFSAYGQFSGDVRKYDRPVT